jgi:co-chaperonin GroES (HSP10)
MALLDLVTPVGDRLLIKCDSENGQSPMFVGRVLNVGPDVQSVAVGADVLFMRGVGPRAKPPNGTFTVHLIDEARVLAVVTGAAADPDAWIA